MKIHFVGIGGIGVSALARYFLHRGHSVSGSDLVDSEIIRDLKKFGIKISLGKHKRKNLPKYVDLVIFSPAVRKDNPELKEAKRRKIKILSYPEALGQLTKEHFTIAVCGTHGKSTTTALIGSILKKAGFDPTVILGTKVKDFNNSNCLVGNSDYLVIEADEHFESFLNYWPKIIVITTLEPDHLDYFKNFRNYILAFKKFISHLPEDGFLVLNKDEKNIKYLTNFTNLKNVKYYSLKERIAKTIKKILKIPGNFNVSNALAALKVAQILKIKNRISFLAISKYKGAWRRLDERKVFLNSKKIILIHDYAHHPTEIKVTLEALAQKYKNKKIYCIFQPHQYERTKFLFEDFVKVLRKFPKNDLIVTEIYAVAGREKKKGRISSKELVKAVNRENVKYIKIPEKALDFLREKIKNGEILACLGAGDIYERVNRYFSKNKLVFLKY